MNVKTAAGADRGLTLIEVLISMIIVAAALGVFLQSVRPTIAVNKSSRQYIDMSGGLSEILDSTMTQPVNVLDGMNGLTYTSRQGVQVKLEVFTYTQSEAEAILPGLDISRMRRLKVSALADPSRYLGATVSNYNDVVSGKCFD